MIILNNLVPVCFIIGLLRFCFKSDDILETAEALSFVFTAMNASVKFTVLWFCSGGVFKAMDEIREMNGKCKKKN